MCSEAEGKNPMASNRRPIMAVSLLWAVVAATVVGQIPIEAVPEDLAGEHLRPIPPDADEAYLLARISRLRRLQYRPDAVSVAEMQIRKGVLIVEAADALLARYPDSTHKDEALIAKLESLAELARFREEFLAQLLALTEEIPKSNPGPELRSENAYFAAEAFVLGARNENMPEEKRIAGQIERYAAFVEDYPQSKRRPIVWASLVRNLLAANSLDRAQAETRKLAEAYPDHVATRRAKGELYRATAVGAPFAFAFLSADGQAIETKDYLGKVLVVHFWAGWRKPAMDELAVLSSLHEKYGENDLRLVGINLDKTRERMDRALKLRPLPWPQYFDGKGLESDAVVSVGVIGIPTYLIVDRDGVLRAITDGQDLAGTIETWIKTPAKSTTGSGEQRQVEPGKQTETKSGNP